MTGSRAPQGIGPLCDPPRFAGKADMPLIKLRKANQDGEEVGVVFVNTDQIVTISTEQNVTEIRLTDGHSQYVKNTPEEVILLEKSSG
jgi:hypothetical protein